MKLVLGKAKKYKIIENPRAGEPVDIRVFYDNEIDKS